MKLGISNIAWDYKHDSEYLDLLKINGFQTLEIAPTKIWPDIAEATKERCQEYKKFASACSISIDSMQSALFGTSNLNIFTTPQEALEYLRKMLQICEWLGITKMVFGSPKNRVVPESMSSNYAKTSAISFFKQLATEASHRGVCICLEPNAKEYGCNFLTNAEETVNFIETVNHPNLKMQLDLGVLIMNNEDIKSSILRASKVIKHIHISAPYLSEIADYRDTYILLKNALGQTDYAGDIVIEMKQQSQENDENFAIVEKSIKMIGKIFS